MRCGSFDDETREGVRGAECPRGALHRRGGAGDEPWGTTRSTRGIDILIEATAENARKVLDALAEFALRNTN